MEFDFLPQSDEKLQQQGVIKPPVKKEKLIVFSLLQYPDLRWLLLGNLGSFMAVGMQQITRGWLILRLTDDSPLALSFVTMAFALPMTFVSLLGGALADRVPRRQLIIITLSISTFMTLIVATLDFTGLIRYWHLIVIGVINGSTVAASMPSRQSIISDIIPEEKLMNAIALGNSAMNATRIIGPMLAGLLIVFINTAGVFYLIAFFHGTAIFFTYMIETGKTSASDNPKSFITDIREGFKYAGKNPVILGLVILSLVPSIFGFPYISLLPAWAREALNVRSDGLGLLMMFMGIGSLSGTLILASMSNLKNRRVFLIMNGLLWGIALYLFSGCKSYVTTLPAIFFVGFLSSVFMALNNTLMQVKSSNEMRGRMVSLTMMTFGVMPLSAVPFGALAERIGTPDSLRIAGLLLCAFIVFFFFFAPAFRNSTK